MIVYVVRNELVRSQSTSLFATSLNFNERGHWTFRKSECNWFATEDEAQSFVTRHNLPGKVFPMETTTLEVYTSLHVEES